jgi:hypothetical protein
VSFENFSGYPCPPFKIIILDEADSMTEDAQVIIRFHSFMNILFLYLLIQLKIFISTCRMLCGELWKHIPGLHVFALFAIT